MFDFFNFFESSATQSAEARRLLGFTGVGFLLAALAIFVFPELVAYLVATILLWLGGTLVGLALRSKTQGAGDQTLRYEYYEFL
ncbi:MAG: hypothetical protein ACE5IY_12335 [bacterium]